MKEKSRPWEQMGAASGLFAVLLFAAAFIVLLNGDPGGGNTPSLPNIANAEASPAYFATHLDGIRAQVMLLGIGSALFLWFLGTLIPRLRNAEGGEARGSSIASAGAVVGVALTLVGLVLIATAAMASTLSQADVVPTLYTAAAVAMAFGGGAFSVFFLAVAEVTLRSGGLPKWLGWLALLAALTSVFGFVTPYAETGVFNAATGGLGFYGHNIAFVVWLFLAGLSLTFAQHRRARDAGAQSNVAAGSRGTNEEATS